MPTGALTNIFTGYMEKPATVYFRRARNEDRRSNAPAELKDAIGGLLKHYRIEGKYNETHILNSWERVMGMAVSRRTTRIFVSDRTLYVELSSAPLKHQLNLSRTLIRERLNAEAKSDSIDEVVFL
ncbi:MAG: DUF721 domain-containing protein [Bacteroidota bacterium]